MHQNKKKLSYIREEKNVMCYIISNIFFLLNKLSSANNAYITNKKAHYEIEIFFTIIMKFCFLCFITIIISYNYFIRTI